MIDLLLNPEGFRIDGLYRANNGKPKNPAQNLQPFIEMQDLFIIYKIIRLIEHVLNPEVP